MNFHHKIQEHHRSWPRVRWLLATTRCGDAAGARRIICTEVSAPAIIEQILHRHARKRLGWLASHMQNVIALMGEDQWPYGIAPNRHVLETLDRSHHEQRLSHRKIGIEEMFAPETLTD